MRRRFFTFASCLSLLLFLGTALLWARSYFFADAFFKQSISTHPRDFAAWGAEGASFRGRFNLQLNYVHCRDLSSEHPGGVTDALVAHQLNLQTVNAVARRAQLQHLQRAAAYRGMLATYSMGSQSSLTHIPADRAIPSMASSAWKWKVDGRSNNDGSANGWIIELGAPYWFAAAVAAGFTMICFRLRGRRRSVRGACSNCSYDLTGNTSGVCPECGAAVAGSLRTANEK